MRTMAKLLMLILTLGFFADVAEAQRRGGGRGGGFRGGGGRSFARAGARPSISSRPSPRADRHFNRPAQRPVERRVDRDVNIDRDININDRRHWDPDYGCCYNHYHPVARAAVATAAVAATAAAIGSTVYTLPPSCTVVVVNDIAYEECDGVWYQPQFVGTSTSYVVVSPPR